MEELQILEPSISLPPQCKLVTHPRDLNIINQRWRFQYKKSSSSGLIDKILSAFDHKLVPQIKGTVADVTVTFLSSSTNSNQCPWYYESQASGRIYHYQNGGLSIWDPANCLAYLIIYNKELYLKHELASPFRNLFHLWLQGSSWQPVHGAGIGNERGGILLAGPSGVGKSNTTVGCLGSPLHIYGDDYVLVKTTKEPILDSLYGTVKLFPKDVKGWAQLAETPCLAKCNGSGKMIYDLTKSPQFAKPATPLKAICVPSIYRSTASECWFEPMRASEVFQALAPSIVFQALAPRQLLLMDLKNLVGGVPGFRLHIPQGYRSISSYLDSFLRSLTPQL